MTTKILVIPGSLREGAYSRKLAREFVRLAPEDVETELYLDLADIPPFNEDIEFEEFPGVVALRTAVRSSHGVVVVTPEYNGSIPGQLKNAFDWLSRSDTDGEPGLPGSAMFSRPVVVASSSQGQFGGVWAADEMKKSLRTQGARVVGETKVSLPAAHQAFDADEQLLQDAHADGVRALLDELLASVQQLRDAGVDLVSA